MGNPGTIYTNKRAMGVASYIYASLKKVNQIHRETKFDLLHSHIYPGALAGYLSSKILRLPHLVTVHGIYYDIYGELSSTWQSVLNTVIERLILGLSYDKMVCVSNSVKDRLERIGASKTKLNYIPNGVDFEKFNPSVNSDLKKWLNIQDKTLITFFGSLTPVKGVKYLISAIPLIKREIKDAKFLIVGEGYRKNYLIELAKKIGVNDSVIFHDYIPHSSMAAFINGSDLVILPSLMEGGPMIPVEAMACKVPVVATSVGGTPEVIKNRQTGILVKPRSDESIAQGVITVLSDKSLRKKITSRGYKFVKTHFSWDIIADKTIELYHSVLEPN